MPTPLREAAFAALAAQLAAALPGVVVERNRRSLPDVTQETLPRLGLMDGDHQVNGSDAHGTVLYRVQALLMGFVSAATDDALGAAVNDLHAQVVAAICNREVVVDPGEQNIWPQEEAFQVVRYTATEADTPLMGFDLTIAFDLRVPDAAGPYTAT